MLRAVESGYACDSKQVRAYALYLCTHAVEHTAQLLYIGLTGGIVDSSGTLGEDGCHNDIRRTGYAGFIKQHIRATETLSAETVSAEVMVVGESSAKVEHTLEVGIQAAATYFVPSRFGVCNLTEACP